MLTLFALNREIGYAVDFQQKNKQTKKQLKTNSRKTHT